MIEKPAVKIFIMLACLTASLTGQDTKHARVQVERPDLRASFSRFKAEGAFVLYAIGADSCVRFNPARAESGFIPASTFKIFNTMAALEAGAIQDDSTILQWDGVKRWVDAWNQDQNMASAFKNSTVWFYQELARRIGSKRMQEMVMREGYGNADLSGGIDAFWLNGGLRISANEQIDFLVKLFRRTLGFPQRAQDIVYRLMVLEEQPAYTLRGKTGWGEQEGKQIGWIVGFITRSGDSYAYALRVESPDSDFPMQKARMAILKDVLRELKLID